jgi:3-oxoacyl-(acyl-carrier-protein) synthase
VEGTVIADMFSDRIPVVSDKAYTGHTLGAAGAIEAVLTVQALIDQKLPQTLGFEERDEECRIQPTTQLTDIDAEFGLSNSLAFGGNNSTLLFGSAG